jgi:plasmid maintenance system antidote protein VapI
VHKLTLAIQADTLALSKAAAAKASISLDTAIRLMLNKGASVEQVIENLQRSFDAGQGPFAELKSMMGKAAVASESHQVSVATARELSGGDPTAMGVWMTTGGANVCEGCEELHGEPMTEAEFEMRHGTNECGGNCKCWWTPGDTAEAGAIIMDDLEDEHPEWFAEVIPDDF